MWQGGPAHTRAAGRGDRRTALREKEPSWHRRARRRRGEARAILRVAKASALLNCHHSAQNHFRYDRDGFDDYGHDVDSMPQLQSAGDGGGGGGKKVDAKTLFHDWDCGTCGTRANFGSRASCRTCGAPPRAGDRVAKGGGKGKGGGGGKGGGSDGNRTLAQWQLQRERIQAQHKKQLDEVRDKWQREIAELRRKLDARSSERRQQLEAIAMDDDDGDDQDAEDDEEKERQLAKEAKRLRGPHAYAPRKRRLQGCAPKKGR